jgi:hypothetical protein
MNPASYPGSDPLNCTCVLGACPNIRRGRVPGFAWADERRRIASSSRLALALGRCADPDRASPMRATPPDTRTGS